MVSKKDALTLGLLAIGGFGIATMVSGGGTGGGGSGSSQPIYSRILTPGSGRAPAPIVERKADVYNTTYNIKQPDVTFPAPDWMAGLENILAPILTPPPQEVVPPKKEKAWNPRTEEETEWAKERGWNWGQPKPKPKPYSGGGGWVDAGSGIGTPGYVTPAVPTPILPPYSGGDGWVDAGSGIGTPGYVTPAVPTPIAPSKKSPTKPSPKQIADWEAEFG